MSELLSGGSRIMPVMDHLWGIEKSLSAVVLLSQETRQDQTSSEGGSLVNKHSDLNLLPL